MKNILRKLTIISKGRYSLFKSMALRRRFDLLNRAKSIHDRCYTKEELNYLF